MKTRTAAPNAPLSQERYMSSREFSELRGVSGVAAAARAAIIPNAEKRKLIWFLQGMSIAEGGMRKVAEDLIAMFPDRVGQESISLAMEGDSTRNMFGIRLGELSVEEFLINFCINPLLHFRLSGDEGSEKAERNLARFNYRGISDREFKPATLSYFKDIISALVLFKAQREREIKENFELTAIGSKIWATLDFALSTRNMVLLDGLEGRGKTEAVKAWCELHLGEARFVSLKGIHNKTTAFREIAKALGIASGYCYKSTELQARVEDVLQRSKLMLVLDEAHFLFNQGQRVYTRPELIDWLDTAIANRKIPVALVTTPQFMICMTRAAAHVDWNYRQFRRRLKRYVKLPPKNTEADILAVARRMLPGAGVSALRLVVGYVLLSKRDLSALGDVVDEIKAIQGSETISKVTYEQVKQALDDHLTPSDVAFAEALKAAETGSRRSVKHPEPLQMAEEASSKGADRDALAMPLHGSRSREVSPARTEMDLTAV